MNSDGTSDGKWEGNTGLMLIGETSTEYEYFLQTSWLWDERPFAYHTDTVGTAWQVEFTGLANTDSAYSWAIASYADGDRMVSTNSVKNLQSEVYGIKANYNLRNWKHNLEGLTNNLEYLRDIVMKQLVL